MSEGVAPEWPTGYVLVGPPAGDPHVPNNRRVFPPEVIGPRRYHAPTHPNGCSARNHSRCESSLRRPRALATDEHYPLISTTTEGQSQ